MAKDIDIKEIIENTAKETARATVSEMRINNMVRKELTYYKRVELLLYNYENLKEAIKQKEEDIEYIDKNGLPEKSGSIVVYSTPSPQKLSFFQCLPYIFALQKHREGV